MDNPAPQRPSDPPEPRPAGKGPYHYRTIGGGREEYTARRSCATGIAWGRHRNHDGTVFSPIFVSKMNGRGSLAASMAVSGSRQKEPAFADAGHGRSLIGLSVGVVSGPGGPSYLLHPRSL